MEGSKSVVKQDPGTPPEGPAEPPALVLATRHNLSRQNVAPPAGPPAPLNPPNANSTTNPSTPMAGSRRKRDHHRHAKASPVGDAVKLEAPKQDKDPGKLPDVVADVKGVKEELSTTTIEESTQTTPPPGPGGSSKVAVAKDVLLTAPRLEDGAPPNKKKKSSKKASEAVTVTDLQTKPSKSKKKKASVSQAAVTPLVGTALGAAAAKGKTPASKSSRKSVAVATAASPADIPTTATAITTAAPAASKKSHKKREPKRTPSQDSNGDAKRAKSKDSASKSRDSSRSSSRSRLSEEEAAAAAVIAAAELPEGVPLNQCRRLIAAQKRLISKCQAKKEREQARLARQEAARAARLAALVSAAEAKKAATDTDSDAARPEQPLRDGEVPAPSATSPRLLPSSSTSLVAAPAATLAPHAGKHHNNNHEDRAVDRSRVEEVGARAGLMVPSCLCISQSELRLLESCAEPKTPKWSNGWQWRGQPFLHRVFLNCDDPPVLRKCFPAMQHVEGDNIILGDTVLLKSGTRKIDLPFVARVIHLWENPEDGEMMLSLVWFYRPEHTEQGRRPCDRDDEIFSSRHKDINSVACIEDKCYVLTFNEYCRYRKTIRRLEEGLSPPSVVVPCPDGKYPRHHRLPPGHVAPDMVFFCRKIYDFRQRRLQKNVF